MSPSRHRARKRPSAVAPIGSAWRRVRRSPAPWWLAGAVLAAVTAMQVHAAGVDAEARRDAWGRSVEVVVVARAVAAGAAIEAEDVAVVERPLAVVPEGAVLEEAVGRVTADALVPGEILVEARLAGGQRVVAVPAAHAPPLAAGDQIELVDTAEPPHVVAAGTVVDVTGDVVTIAVPAADAPAAAAVSARGTAALVTTRTPR